jgi:excisionase family DNA binding protein
MRLGVAYSTLKQWIYAGRVRTIRTAGGHHRIPDEEVDRLRSRPASASRTRKPPGDRAAVAVLSDANRVRVLSRKCEVTDYLVRCDCASAIT